MMEGVLIALAFALAVNLAFMVIIMKLYLNLEQDLKGTVPQIEAVREQCREVLKVANGKAEHARVTMQEARKLNLVTRETNVAPEDKPFVFIEKEENPEEPRS